MSGNDYPTSAFAFLSRHLWRLYFYKKRGHTPARALNNVILILIIP